MRQAMIFAAGLGTRLKPLTDKVPKALIKVGGVPLLERVICNLRASGFDKIVVNTHHFSEQIKTFLAANDNFGLDIRVSDETDRLLDTGGGIKKASCLFSPDSPILIHNVDILSNVSLSSFYESNKNNDVTLLVSRRETKRYLIFDASMALRGWTNKETGETRSPYDIASSSDNCLFAFSGIHMFSPRLFPLLDAFPDKFGIMDFYLSSCDKISIYGHVKDDLSLIDVGKLDTLSAAEDFLKNLK